MGLWENGRPRIFFFPLSSSRVGEELRGDELNLSISANQGATAVNVWWEGFVEMYRQREISSESPPESETTARLVKSRDSSDGDRYEFYRRSP
ncbi:hypothetical protein NL676_006089 [Syzygium grande]|nr:hypothetical protein NL676_006089 [Syzygium grande]